MATEDEGSRRLVGDRGRRAFGAVEQRELAEEITRAQRGDDGLVFALWRGQHDLHGTRLDDVERVARVALVEDRLVAAVAARPQRIDADGQRAIIHLRKERAASELSLIHISE